VRPEEIPPELAGMPAAAAGRAHSRDGRVMTALAAILTRREEIRDGHLCGQSPPPDSCPSWLAGLKCEKTAGHAAGKPAERHEAAGYWWSERQHAPVQLGHIHSTGYLCSPICPGYEGGGDPGW